jgi:hypothetical protein
VTLIGWGRIIICALSAGCEIDDGAVSDMQAAHAHAARLMATKRQGPGTALAVGVKTPAPALSHSHCLQVLVPTLLVLLVLIQSVTFVIEMLY